MCATQKCRYCNSTVNVTGKVTSKEETKTVTRDLDGYTTEVENTFRTTSFDCSGCGETNKDTYKISGW